MKKVLILFLAVSFLAASLVTAPNYAAETELYSGRENIIYGDADCNGTVTVLDSIIIARFASGLLMLGEDGKAASDVNADGSVNVGDSVLVAKYCAAMISRFPAESGCAHNYTEVVTVSTCEKSGYTTYTCSNCGDTYTGNETAALGHDYVETAVNATCTEAGSVTTTCSRCDYESVQEITALGHNYTSVVTAPSRGPSGLRKTNWQLNSLAHRTTWLRSDLKRAL